MKKILLLSSLLISSIAFTQTNDELKSEIEKIKIEIVGLKTEVASVKSQNLYLKKILDINNPILEQKKDNNEYRITKVVGNKKDKTITINFLVESKNENKTSSLQDFSIVDLLGNEYEVDFSKSSNLFPKLTLDVPINIKITFQDIIEELKVIKLFRFSTRNQLVENPFNNSKSNQDFRDLNVTWE